MSFIDKIQSYHPQQVEDQIASKTPDDVERALLAERLSEGDFMALLSPAAQDYLEPLAQKAHRITRRRFGNTILLYAPLYLSNECHNGCLYCGFSAENKVARRTLDLAEIERDAQVLAEQGFRHILLLTGEAPKVASVDYLAAAVERVQSQFSSICI